MSRKRILYHLLCALMCVVDSHNIALCVTGQLSRLELDSKVRQFIVPNVAAGHKIHLFMSLYKKSDKRVTSIGETIVSSPNAKVNDQGEYEINFQSSSTTRKKKIKRNKWVYNVTHLIASTGSASYDVTIDLQDNVMDFHPLDKVLLRQGATSSKWKKVDPIFREKLHMSQWINTRRCMELIEQQEFSQGYHFDAAVRMRDDIFVFDKMLLPVDSTERLITLNCFNWYGLNDAIYIIGRKWASQFFRSFSEDYYIKHKQLNPKGQNFIGNPEHWALHYSLKYQIPTRPASMCEIPAFPLVRTSNGLVPKKSHLDGLCAFSRSCRKNSSAFKRIGFTDFGKGAGFCFPSNVNACPRVEKLITNYFLDLSAVGNRTDKKDEIEKLKIP